MLKHSKKIVSSLLLLTSLSLYGCGTDSSGDSEESGGSGDSLVLGTGGSSGTYYAVGAGLSNVWNNQSEDLNTVSQGTNGAIENIRLVSSGGLDVGMANWDALYFGDEGSGPFDEEQNIESLMTLYLSGGQMAVKENSNIDSYEDLEGKTVNLGPQGSTITEMSKIILESYGVDPEEDINAQYLSFDEGGSKLQDNDLDATFYVAGIPTSGLIDLSSSEDITLLNLDEKNAQEITEEYPYYETLTIPGGTYDGIEEDTETLQLWTSMVVNPDMSEDQAYELVKTTFENLEEVQEIHNVTSDMTIEDAAQTPIPMHPGAEKYFEEEGALDE